jgi:hypothetical protein
MAPSTAEHHADRFALTLVSTASMLHGLVSALADALPADAYPGEAPTAVVVEMLCGTIVTALESVDSRDVACATDLIERSCAQVVEHLELAFRRSRRIHPDRETERRADG